MLVIGVGNPFRGDDGVGHTVAGRLRGMRLPGVEVLEETGEPAALLARWKDRELAVLVDAVISGSPPGTVHRIEYTRHTWSASLPGGRASTHGLGIHEAVELGELLENLPLRLIVYGIEVDDTGLGVGLTPAVDSAADDVVARIAGEVGNDQG